MSKVYKIRFLPKYLFFAKKHEITKILSLITFYGALSRRIKWLYISSHFLRLLLTKRTDFSGAIQLHKGFIVLGSENKLVGVELEKGLSYVVKSFPSEKECQDEYDRTSVALRTGWCSYSKLEKRKTRLLFDYLPHIRSASLKDLVEIKNLIQAKQNTFQNERGVYLSLGHGDLAFWNVIALYDGDLRLIDFEYFGIYPVGFDLYYFCLYSSLKLGADLESIWLKCSITIIKFFEEQCLSYLDYFDLFLDEIDPRLTILERKMLLKLRDRIET